ncbi:MULTISPECIES: hypothetical protein [Bacillaceae]|nr:MULTISPECIES: hypothetical protein [Bacillaceae]
MTRIFVKETEEGELVKVELTNEVMISAFENEGFKEVKEDKKKK